MIATIIIYHCHSHIKHSLTIMYYGISAGMLSRIIHWGSIMLPLFWFSVNKKRWLKEGSIVHSLSKKG